MEDIYWETNRHVNILRRVCKSFDVYLRRFEHRYIRLIDLHHNRVPIEAVSKAIRIDLTSCHRESIELASKCDFCGPPESPRNLTDFLSAIPDQKFAVEIVTGQAYWDFRPVSEFLDIMHSRLRGLKAIFDATINDDDEGDRLMRALKSQDISQLHFLHIKVYDVEFPSFTARNLTTFAYSNEEEPFPEWMATTGSQNQLSALQHLCFLTSLSNENFSCDKLIAILKVFGPQLRSLQIGICHNKKSGLLLSNECWEFCPQLERIDTTLTLDTPPPQDHPVQTISVFAPTLVSFFESTGGWSRLYRDPFQIQFLNQISDRSHIQRIVLQPSWKEISKSSTRGGEDGAKIRAWVRDCATICREKGVKLEDCYGEELEDDRLDWLFFSS